MKISEKFWQNTKALSSLNIFPGLLGEFLVGSQKEALKRVKKFLSHIFWRWYFLECEYSSGTNPYFNLEHLRKIEKWPKDGQFFPRAKIEEVDQNKCNISIVLDYISFEEQPLFIDLKNVLVGTQKVFNFDEKYHSDLDFLVKYCLENNFGKYLSLNQIHKLIKIYFEKNLKNWYEKDNFIQEAFTLESWLFFWREILENINQRKHYNTEELNDDFFGRMRQFFPDYGYRSEELGANSALTKRNFSTVSYFNFWLNFAYNFLVPLSLYLNLLAPTFLNQLSFKDDIKDILKYNYKEPMPIYAPCSYLYLTPFGRKAFK